MKEYKLYDVKLETELTYMIGADAKDNWNLIDASDPDDIWFHLDLHPSSHVVLKMPDKIDVTDISKQSLIHCAVECKAHSKLKDVPNKQKVKVIYTEIKNVTKAKTVGSVTIKNERIISI